MYISELFDQKKAVISFEIFPPKQTSSIVTIYETIDALAPLRPDYISVTYGAGGSTSKTTLEIASIIKNKYRINALAHLTCFNSSREDIDKMLTDLEKENIANVLALRGDRPRTWKAGEEKESDFKYAADLAKFISSKHKFCLGGACYPEGHPECSDLDRDVENLKRKEEAGVDFLITQLFFYNEKYYRFKEKADKSGIKIPIQAGIMPITNRKQVERMIELSNATIPHKLVRILDKFEHNQQAIRDAGIAYATEQIIELLANEIRGIHIYTMNKPQIAKDLVRNLDSILYALNN
jgi:methylenetetrahydrofolate reductase (NADPH)